MKQIAGWLLALGSTLGLGGLVSQALGNWLRQQGYLEHPETAIAAIFAWLGDLSKSWWLLPICAILLIVSGGSWGYRKYAEWSKKREDNLKLLGKKMTAMATQVRISQAGFRNRWPDNIQHLRGTIEAIFEKAKGLWLSSPSNSVFDGNGPEKLLEYLETIGAHLNQGNYSVAKKRSRELSS